MINILEKIALFNVAFIEALEQHISSVFKAGIALLVVALIGLSEPFLKVIEMDYTTRKLQYEVVAELELKDSSIENIACHQVKKSMVASCLYAQYRTQQNYNTITLTAMLISFCLVTGFALIFISLITFLGNVSKQNKPLRQRPYKPWAARSLRSHSLAGRQGLRGR